ncbi:glycosyltransferase family 2 protein [Gramella jeungdoensis]|uniref:Glycosyltransferase family 2 protein n=1 Tax=Gramella jeungdoensis TaxID=708091 RepID=A0ABT0Z1B3_9FLAO|nr:glycosyltransferase family 2 protein [Gramella jeungdoensis]MCM8569203.1 glycosyltransferase family 2 protein [Gramella jeungdoensis]
MEPTNIKVYALILNYNTAEESIKLYNNLADFSFYFLKILIIDNASNNNDINRLKEHIPEDQLILNNSNLGYAGGNNVGLDIALKNNADYVWLLNPDIRVDVHALPLLIETFEENDMLAAVGPRIIRRENRERIFTDGDYILMDENCSTIQKNFNKPVAEVGREINFEVDYIDGSCVMFSADALKKLGRLPEEYFLYFEETDWCFNARSHGWYLGVNTFAVVYNKTSKKRENFHYYFNRNKLIFSKKYHPNYKQVRNYYIKEIFKEFINWLKHGRFRPFFKYYVKGVLAGIYRNCFVSRVLDRINFSINSR